MIYKRILLALSFLCLFVGLQAQMPGFSFEKTDHSALTPETLMKGKPTIVFFFDPDCEHCQDQAGRMKPYLAQFKDVNLIWVSWGEMDAIKKFQTTFIGSASNIHFAKDVNYAIDRYFGESNIPTVHIFGKDGKKITTLSEVADAADIKAYL